MNKNIFKLTHSYAENSVIAETELSEEELVKLIKVWQIKAWYILDTFDFFPKEMFKVLQPCGITIHKMQKGEKKITLDLYEIWEACDIKVENDDLITNKYLNDESTKEFLKILTKELS